MNDLVRFAMSVEYATGKKRGRRPVFSSNKFYPYKEELQLQQATGKELERFIEEAYGVAISGEVFAFSDDLNALSNLSEDLPDSFKSEVSAIGRAIGQNVSNVIANSSEMIVGKPYYPPAAKDEIFKTWEANFQMLCKSAESDIKKDISRIVAQAKNEGWNGKQVEKAVKKELPEKYKNRAELISRTEAAKLNTQATISTYKQIGCQYYKWMSTLDERVRLTHENMNDKICSIENPDVYYEETPDGLVEHERGDDMVHLHPGEDFQCRCTMVMWDPAIDGKYEVKEKPEEEKTEEPEKRTENNPASRELEKANERLAEQEKELERAENERKAVENELAQEKSARKTAEKRAEILEKSNERHINRSVEERERIQNLWDFHREVNDLKTYYKSDDFKLLDVKEKRNLHANIQNAAYCFNSFKTRYDSAKVVSVLNFYKKESEKLVQIFKSRKENKFLEKASASQRKKNLKLDAQKLYPNDTEAQGMLTVLGVKKGNPMSLEEADTGRENPFYKKVKKCDVNCQSQVIVHEMRMRGYDVQTRPRTFKEQNNLSYVTRKWVTDSYGVGHAEFEYHTSAWTNISPKQLDGRTTNELVIQVMEYAKEKGRYNMAVDWKGSKVSHIFTVINDGAEIYIHDGQVPDGRKIPLSEYLKRAKIKTSTSWGPFIYRVDNAKFNPSGLGMDMAFVMTRKGLQM